MKTNIIRDHKAKEVQQNLSIELKQEFERMQVADYGMFGRDQPNYQELTMDELMSSPLKMFTQAQDGDDLQGI